MPSGYFRSVLSGMLGATASLLGKLAFSPEVVILGVAPSAPYFHLGIRVFLFLSMIACNAYMLGTLLEGLEDAGSVTGTALSTAANFSVSALWGYLMWGERYPPLWWLGLGMLFAGTTLLLSGQQAVHLQGSQRKPRPTFADDNKEVTGTKQKAH